MKKQAATLEEIKTLTNQVQTLTPGTHTHQGGGCTDLSHFWKTNYGIQEVNRDLNVPLADSCIPVCDFNASEDL